MVDAWCSMPKMCILPNFIDVKNINLQIKKKHKNMFLNFYKNI